MVGKILIVDDVATNRIVMKVKLAAAGYLPTMAWDGASCLAAAKGDCPDLILLDMMLPDMHGLEVLEQLRQNPKIRRIPIVMFSSTNDAHVRARAFELGADDFLSKPIDDQTLLARLRNLLRSQQLADELVAHEEGFAMLGLAESQAEFQPATTVGLITQRPEQALRLRRELSGRVQAQFQVMTPEEAILQSRSPQSAPDIYVLEVDVTGPYTGLRLMSELRSRSHSHHAAFCLVTDMNSDVTPSVAFDLGANDLVSIDVSSEELASRISRLILRKREEDRLRASVQDGLRLAVIDPLTGLHNRRFSEAQLSAIARMARQERTVFSVMIVDLDRFKSVNDRWGHAAGDAVLVQVAKRLSQNLRPGDLVARIGGEEFLIALPRTSLADGQVIAERLCETMEHEPFELTEGRRLRMTVSIGLSASDATDLTSASAVTDLVAQADRALLLAKSAGRNQVTLGRTAA